jgi:GTPase SAR1 family protein
MGLSDIFILATVGADVCHLTLQTTSGEVRFYIWDVSGSIEGRSVQNALFAHSDCAIIMFDRTSINTSEHVSNWYDDLQRVCGNIPVVAVGNKNESKNRKDGSYRTRDLTVGFLSGVLNNLFSVFSNIICDRKRY